MQRKYGAFIIAGLVSAFIGFFTLYSFAPYAPNADLVIFSYNRPLQLYSLLESVEKLLSGVGQVHVIYRADGDAFAHGYDEVKKDFEYVYFHKQGANPRADFKPLTLHATFDSPSEYVIFGVDDIVVKDHADLAHCIALLEKHNAYGFYLRLGTHLTHCYAHHNAPQPVPSLKQVDPGVYAWIFGQARYDWGYPHSVDMNIFRKKDIKDDFEKLNFTNPNTLEGNWAARAGKVMQRCGLCFETTKIVNLPFNLVQTTWANPNMNSYSPQDFLAIFNEGKKMAIDDLYQIKNPSAHMDFEPSFVAR